jgi:hypothetical protein
MCVPSQSMQRVVEVVIEACKRFAGKCKWFRSSFRIRDKRRRCAKWSSAFQDAARVVVSSECSQDVWSCRCWRGMDNNAMIVQRFASRLVSSSA